MEITFEKWRSIPRRSKEVMTLTEKLDGTNACFLAFPTPEEGFEGSKPLRLLDVDGVEWGVWAQSRTRFIYPDSDNFGFAKWVDHNAEQLIRVLGIGKHYGEWWGSGIQRGYGIPDKRFSLFHATRWKEAGISHLLPTTPVSALRIVPLLYHGPYSDAAVEAALETLRSGSMAAPVFSRAEGIVVDLREAGARYKILLEGDNLHKWEAQ